MTIGEFLLARIAEDEDVAKRAAWGYGAAWVSETDEVEDWSDVHADGKRDMVGCEDGDVTRHIARHDPARVLAECEAKRRIVELHEPIKTDDGPAACAECASDWFYPCDTLRWLVSIYADHPDYDDAWKP